MRFILPFLLLLPLACQTVDHETELTQSLQGLSTEEILDKGKGFMEEENWEDARICLRYLYENFPNSPHSVEALLLLADSLYKEGGLENLIRAYHRYEDFFNRFPQSPRSSYALFQMGVCTFAQHQPPDRDQRKTKEALKIFKRYLELYPQGKERNNVQAYIQKCQNLLAEHEYLVAYFYFKQKSYHAALKRLEYLWSEYPQSDVIPKSYQLAAKCYAALGDEELEKKYEALATKG